MDWPTFITFAIDYSMSYFAAIPASGALIKLSGKIVNYSATSGAASFVFTKTDQTKFGLIAIAASLGGMGGQAISIASNTTAMEEEADYVQFEIGGKNVSGWLWRSPFKEGDIVDAAVEWRSDHYELLGMTRPADRIVALYPHCARSLRTHFKNAFKWWIYVCLFVDLGMIVVTSSLESVTFKEMWADSLEDGGALIMLGMHIVIGIAVYSMTKQWAPFAKIAEKVFSTLGLSNPKNIDLVKSPKGKHQPADSMEFGVMYFRY